MRNEADFKEAFVKSVRSQGGYALRLAAPTMPGLPDLYVIMPDYMPVLMEAKYLKEVIPTFKRRVQYSPMQLSYAHKVNAVQSHAMLGLVGLNYNGEDMAVLQLINGGTNILSYDQLEKCPKVTRQGKLYDVRSLFEQSTIPKIEAGLAYQPIRLDYQPVSATDIGALAVQA